MAAPDTTGDRERPQGTLTVVRPASPVEAVKFETFIRITADGSVAAYNGHVDLGTGIRTALGQIVAEELDVSFARVIVVLGDTSLVPNQGATIASETIQITAVPLRKAAAVGIVTNPFAGRFENDLSALTVASEAIGREICAIAVQLLAPDAAISYGKAAVVGINGEQIPGFSGQTLERKAPAAPFLR